MNEPPASDRKIYLEGNYEYRRWPVFFGGLVACALGIVPFTLSLPSLFQRKTWVDPMLVPGLLFMFGIPLLLIWAGAWLLYAWRSRHIRHLEISDRGIQYGSVIHSWNEVKWIFARYEGRLGLTLVYQKTGFSPDRPVIINDRVITEGEVEELFEKLSAEIQPDHPHLSIGG